jgi:hypothetical protein
MGKNAILVLQGGGALGAYECGAYKALVPHLKLHGYSLTVVAGTSIGAINASVIATRYHRDQDHGVRALEKLWTQRLTTLSPPFFPPVPMFESYNAIWTLFGNPHLFSPYFFGWTFFAPIFWGGITRFYVSGFWSDAKNIDGTVRAGGEASRRGAAPNCYRARCEERADSIVIRRISPPMT